MADRRYNNKVYEEILTEDGIPIRLTRYQHNGFPPVLLIHGASAGAETFMIPHRDGTQARSLADFLYDNGYEPWLLDWRASKNVSSQEVELGHKGISDLGKEDKSHEFPDRRLFSMDRAAEYDIPMALREIRRIRGNAHSISVVGWCLGSGVLAQSIAQGYISQKTHNLSHVVLMTLGLFYDTPVDTRLKAEERLLERLGNDHNEIRTIDPDVSHNGRAKGKGDWPDTIDRLYQDWPSQLKPHGNLETDHENYNVMELCNRLSFMYGMPYVEKNLVPEIHRETVYIPFTQEPPEKEKERPEKGQKPPSFMDTVVGSDTQRQGILAYCVHTSGKWEDGDASGIFVFTNITKEFEKGEPLKVNEKIIAYATDLSKQEEDPFIAKRPPLLLGQFGGIPLFMYINAAKNVRQGLAVIYNPAPSNDGAASDQEKWIDTDALNRFTSRGNFEKVTLITGGLNRLWHRESIDRMYEWFMRGNGFDRNRFKKIVLPKYGHQDLLWGKRAYDDVFKNILDGIKTKSLEKYSSQ